MKHALAVFLLTGATAAAHDGGFGHSRRTLYFAAGPGEWRIAYRLVLNRDEALAEMALMDTDGDGQVSAKERDQYFAARAGQLAERLRLRPPDGAALPLKFIRHELGPALSQTYHFTAATGAAEVLLDDRNFPHKPGVVQVRHAVGLAVELAQPADLNHAERVTLRVRRQTED